MKIRFSILILLFSMVLAISCAKDYYKKSEDPKARSNNYYMRTDEDVEIEDHGLQQDSFDASHGCSLIIKK